MAVAVVAVVAGVYLVASLVGRSSDPLGGVPADLPAPTPGTSLSPGPSASGDEQAVAAGLPGGPAQPRAARPRPAAVAPLPRAAGPFGSRRTTGEAYVALTFDDGPDPRWTPQVLELLREYEVTATFCVVGELAQAYPELIAAIAADGHVLCNHSWSHEMALGSWSKAEIRANLERTNEAIRAAVPRVRIPYYRQPGGNWTAAVVDVAEELGMTSLHWDVDPQDWRKPGAAAIATAVVSATGPGSIVLLHDGGGERHGTVKALRTILPDLTNRFEVAALPTGRQAFVGFPH